MTHASSFRRVPVPTRSMNRADPGDRRCCGSDSAGFPRLHHQGHSSFTPVFQIICFGVSQPPFREDTQAALLPTASPWGHVSAAPWKGLLQSQPSDNCSSGCHCNTDPVRDSEPEMPHKTPEIRSHYCFKPLSFGVICFTAADD